MGIFHEVAVESMLIRNGQFKHQLGILQKLCQMFLDFILHDLLRLSLIRAVNINLRLQYGNQSRSGNAKPDFKLLVHNLFDSHRICLLNHGTHLGAENMALHRTPKEFVQSRNGLHQPDSVRFLRQALIHLQNGNDSLLLPQVIRSQLIPYLPLHGILKKDGCQDMV